VTAETLLAEPEAPQPEPAAPPPPPRVLVTGGHGMLGPDLLRELQGRGWPVTAPTQQALDVTYDDHLRHLARRDYGDFDWIVNCAAYTAVDQAESEFMAATAVNGIAAGALAAVCAEKGWRMLHVSTDYVFDGQLDRHYREDDPPNPINAYGRSKLFGEQQVRQQAPDAIIVRTSWLFGPSGKSFPRTILEAHRAGKPLRVVDDQWGRPTYTADLARTIADLVVLAPAGGIYHAAGPEVTNWHGLAVATLAAEARRTGAEASNVEAVPSSAYPTPARRPERAVLDLAKAEALGLSPMRPLSASLDEFVARLDQ
jgi:dTDP-4-dehydrorhamnose reductase